MVHAGDTRFATLFIMLQRWVDIRKQVQTAILGRQVACLEGQRQGQHYSWR